MNKTETPAKGKPSGRAPVRDRTDVQEYLDRVVYPALLGRLSSAFPEFGWISHGRLWQATAWPAGFPVEVESKRPERLQVYPDAPHWIKLHGRYGVRWLDYVAGQDRPRGERFTLAVKMLCDKAGVAHPPMKEPTPEQLADAQRREQRRDILAEVVTICASSLRAPAGESARTYLAARGVDDAVIAEFKLGFANGSEVVNQLVKRGFSRETVKDLLPGLAKINGYVVIPWLDELGRPLTIYGRWPGDPPLKKDHDGWSWARGKDRETWEQTPADDRPEWVEPRLPKTYALPGANSKCSPLYLDRVLKAKHNEAVLVEGVLDALVLQARGETRACASVAAQLAGEQLETLARAGIKRVFICGDPDGGGDTGNIRNTRALAERGITPYVVPRLPESKDPDEWVIAHGIDAWRTLVDRSAHGFRHLAEQVIAAHRKAHGERGDGDDLWTDRLIEAALSEARTLPGAMTDEVKRHFVPAIAEQGLAGDGAEELVKRITGAQAEGEGGGSGWKWEPATLADWDAMDTRLDWLVERVLVRGQPVVIGGPEKTLKTSLAIDLAVSLGAGVPFLGVHPAAKCRVAVLSGESGRHAITNTARRVCAARGVVPRDVDCLCHDKIPAVGLEEDLANLSAGLEADKVEVVIIDPLYLALLAGGVAVDPANMYQMGPLLAGVCEACMRAGSTPILIHHTNRTGSRSREPLNLTDLAYSGIGQFARQWLLISHREDYEPDAPVKLWLRAGGSAGQAGLWAVDVNEGPLDMERGRTLWEVTVDNAGHEIERRKTQAKQRREEEQRRTEKDEETKLLMALDAADPQRKGIATKVIAEQCGMSRYKIRLVVARLDRERIIETIPGFCVEGGNGAKQTATGIRRKAERNDNDEY